MDRTQQIIKLFDQYAETYQDRYMDMSLYHDSLDMLCVALGKESAAVLEIACGPGNITKYLLGKRPNFNILGIDLSPKMIELARINNPSAEFRIMDARSIGSLKQKYDAVVCGFGLPYLSKEETFKLIREAKASLNPQGALYLSTMEDAYDKSGFKTSSSGGEEKLFIYYHEAGYLRKALRENGFDILRLTRKVYSAPEGGISRDLLILAVKKRESEHRR